MKEIKAIVFRIEGTLTLSFTSSLLRNVGIRENNLSDKQKVLFKKLEKSIFAGELSEEDYVRKASKVLGIPVQVEDINKNIFFNKESLTLMKELNQFYSLILISSLFQGWQQAVFETCPLKLELKVEHISKRYVELSSLISFMETNLNFKRKEYLLIDNNSHRCMEAICEGLQSNIYVDVRRLRRDLCLWSLINK